jgi:hypothetical protein
LATYISINKWDSTQTILCFKWMNLL